MNKYLGTSMSKFTSRLRTHKHIHAQTHTHRRIRTHPNQQMNQSINYPKLKIKHQTTNIKHQKKKKFQIRLVYHHFPLLSISFSHFLSPITPISITRHYHPTPSIFPSLFPSLSLSLSLSPFPFPFLFPFPSSYSYSPPFPPSYLSSPSLLSLIFLPLSLLFLNPNP